MKRGWLLIGLIVAAAVVINAVRSDESFAVEGNFILWDDYPGKVDGQRCTGERSLYHGLNASTQVTLETATGEFVAGAPLGEGRIASSADLLDLFRLAGEEPTVEEVDRLLSGVHLAPCLFDFQLPMDSSATGTSRYVVRLGTWGELAMSADDLRKPGAVQLSVGLR